VTDIFGTGGSLVLDSAASNPFPDAGNKSVSADEITMDEALFDSAEDDYGSKQERALGMAAALEFIGGDDYSWNMLNGLVTGLADADGDGEITDEEEEAYNAILATTADALVELGGNKANVKQFIDDEDSEAGEKLANYLSKRIEDSERADDEIISRFALKASAILDGAKIRVVRNGVVTLVRKTLRKPKLSAAQKAALKKARKKAHSASARRKRAKSMGVRKKRGM